jgi:hypothetical protein
MNRVLLQYLLPLLLPTVLYLLWWMLHGRKRLEARGDEPSLLVHGPWFWLALAGGALMGAGLIYTALTSGFDPNATYVAPRYEDGRVVPGQIQ